jgi:hypothetical protein
MMLSLVPFLMVQSLLWSSLTLEMKDGTNSNQEKEGETASVSEGHSLIVQSSITSTPLENSNIVRDSTKPGIRDEGNSVDMWPLRSATPDQLSLIDIPAYSTSDAESVLAYDIIADERVDFNISTPHDLTNLCPVFDRSRREVD